MNADYIVRRTTEFVDMVKKDHDLCLAIDTLESLGRLVVHGETVRDIIFSSLSGKFTFVLDANAPGIVDVMTSVGFKKGPLGFYKIARNGITVEVKLINDMWAFRYGGMPVSINNLRFTSFYNIDSVFYEMGSNRVDLTYLNEYTDTELVDIVIPNDLMFNFPYPEYNVLKAMYFGKHQNMKLSDKTLKFVRFYINNVFDAILKISSSQERFLGQSDLISDDDIMWFYKVAAK